MSFNPITDIPFETTTTPADTLLVSSIPQTFRDMKTRINEVVAGLYSSLVDVGKISIWGSNTPPANHIEVAGQDLTSNTAFAAIRSIYGNTAPDYRGWFLRGWAHGKSASNGNEVDYNRGIGSQQGWMIGRHNHTVDVIRGIQQANANTNTNTGVYGNTNTSDAGGDDNRPSNIAVMYIMRYQ